MLCSPTSDRLSVETKKLKWIEADVKLTSGGWKSEASVMLAMACIGMGLAVINILTCKHMNCNLRTCSKAISTKSIRRFATFRNTVNDIFSSNFHLFIHCIVSSYLVWPAFSYLLIIQPGVSLISEFFMMINQGTIKYYSLFFELSTANSNCNFGKKNFQVCPKFSSSQVAMQTVVVKQGYKSCENTLNIQLLWFIHIYICFIYIAPNPMKFIMIYVSWSKTQQQNCTILSMIKQLYQSNGARKTRPQHYRYK